MKRYWLHLSGQSEPQSELEVKQVFHPYSFSAGSSLDVLWGNDLQRGMAQSSPLRNVTKILELQFPFFKYKNKKEIKLYQYLVYFLISAPILCMSHTVCEVLQRKRVFHNMGRLPLALTPLLLVYCKVLPLMCTQLNGFADYIIQF